MKRPLSFSPAKRRLLKRGVSLAVAPVMLLGSLSTQAKGETIGDYALYNGSFNNMQGSLGSLTVVGSEEGSHGFTPNGWGWSNVTAPGIGLNLQIGSVLSTYSVAIVFQYSQVADVAKLLSFGNMESDMGLYVIAGGLSLIGDGGESGGIIHANTPVSMIMTRSEGGTVSIYLDGNDIAALEIEDPNANFTIQSQLNFFLDDDATEGTEFSAGGSVSRIMIWDHAIPKAEIPDTFNVIPEPSVTALIGGLGFAGLLYTRARRKRS